MAGDTFDFDDLYPWEKKADDPCELMLACLRQDPVVKAMEAIGYRVLKSSRKGTHFMDKGAKESILDANSYLVLSGSLSVDIQEIPLLLSIPRKTTALDELVVNILQARLEGKI